MGRLTRQLSYGSNIVLRFQALIQSIFVGPAGRGFRAALPLWLAIGPAALAYAAAARAAGLSGAETQLMSATLYSAAAQIAVAQLVGSGAPILTIGLTALVMNAHQVLYGISLGRSIRMSAGEKAIAGYGLSDAAYGLTMAAGTNQTIGFLLGAEASLFIAWNGFTAAAVLAGSVLKQAVGSAALAWVVPAVFTWLAAGMIETRRDLIVAGLCAGLAALMALMGLGQLAVIAAGVGGPLAALMLNARRKSA